MGQIKSAASVVLMTAAFAKDENDLAWGRAQMTARFGDIILESSRFCVDDYTSYYTKTMGAKLIKQFWAFENLIAPDALAEIKNFTNECEDARGEEFSKKFIKESNEKFSSVHESPTRPLNLDPGYVDLGKLILASTKDHAHRIYLRDGIFAETTLTFTRGAWHAFAWTYPDYQTPLGHDFLNQCRVFLSAERKKSKGAR